MAGLLFFISYIFSLVIFSHHIIEGNFLKGVFIMNAFTQVVKTTLILNAIAIAVGGGVAVTKEAVKFVKNKRDEKKNYYKAEIIEVC